MGQQYSQVPASSTEPASAQRAKGRCCWLPAGPGAVAGTDAEGNCSLLTHTGLQHCGHISQTLPPVHIYFRILHFKTRQAQHTTASTLCELKDHAILAWFGLEGTLKIIWFQPPCHEQGNLPPDQVAQSSIQPGLEHCQGGGSHSFSGQPVPVPHHPHSKEFLLYISSKSTVFQFKAITP